MRALRSAVPTLRAGGARVSSTDAQRLAEAEATARRWFRVLESMAGTETPDEVFSLAHQSWVAAEQAVRLQRAGARPPPPSQRS